MMKTMFAWFDDSARYQTQLNRQKLNNFSVEFREHKVWVAERIWRPMLIVANSCLQHWLSLVNCSLACNSRQSWFDPWWHFATIGHILSTLHCESALSGTRFKFLWLIRCSHGHQGPVGRRMSHVVATVITPAPSLIPSTNTYNR